MIVWVAESTWHSCGDAARRLAPPVARIVLLHVTPQEVPGAAHGAYAGLLGRGHPERDPGRRVEELAAASAAELLEAAARRLARPRNQMQRQGRAEREVVAAAEGADLLILARDGDRSRLGPKSLGPASRFAVDHARARFCWSGPASHPASAISHPLHPTRPATGRAVGDPVLLRRSLFWLRRHNARAGLPHQSD